MVQVVAVIAMGRASKKQIMVTAELVGRSLHYLDELGVDYAVVIKGTPVIFSNVDKRYALALIEDAAALQNKILEERMTAEAERLSDTKINPDDEAGAAA